MASSTTVTAQRSIPIIIGWKCSKCGAENATSTALTITKVATKSGALKTEEFKQANSDALDNIWIESTVNIMKDPRKHAAEFRSCVYSKPCLCKNCNNKERWASKPWWNMFLGIIFFAFIFSVIAVFAGGGLPAWIALLISAGLSAADIVEENTYKKKFSELSDELTPKIITLNEEVNDFANSVGYNILSEENLKYTLYLLAGKTQTISLRNPIIGEKEVEDQLLKNMHCSKCGKKLKPNSEFCSCCGANIKD